MALTKHERSIAFTSVVRAAILKKPLHEARINTQTRRRATTEDAFLFIKDLLGEYYEVLPEPSIVVKPVVREKESLPQSPVEVMLSSVLQSSKAAVSPSVDTENS